MPLRIRVARRWVPLAAAMAISIGIAEARQEPAVVFQPDMPPAGGAMTLLALQEAAARAQDRVLPPQPFGEERGAARRTLGVAWRLGKLIALDTPQDSFLVVFAHEVYGHGARFRELEMERRRYSFELPPPYGGGGGRASARSTRPLRRGEVAAINTGGLEVQAMLNAGLARRTLPRGDLHYREALLYLGSHLAALSYVLDTPDDRVPAGHDVANFLETINEGCVPPACRPITPADARRRALIGLLDPLLAWSAGTVISYAALGRSSMELPMLPVTARVRYLPSLTLMLAPYGTEWTFQNHLVRDGRPLHVTIRSGDAGPRTAWGASVELPVLVRRPRLDLGGAVHLWQQPVALSRLAERSGTGAALTVTAVVPLGAIVLGRAVGVHVTTGYKSAGFLPGERLARGPVLRLGVSLSDRP